MAETGRKLSDETKRKMSLAAKKRYKNKEERKKQSERMKAHVRKTGKSNNGVTHEMVQEKKEYWLKVADESFAVIREACNKTGIARNTIYEWFTSDPEFKRRYDEIYEQRKEFCENELFKLIKKGNAQAIMFALKTKFGYTEKVEVDAKVDSNVKIFNIDPIKNE